MGKMEMKGSQQGQVVYWDWNCSNLGIEDGVMIHSLLVGIVLPGQSGVACILSCVSRSVNFQLLL